MTNVVRSVCAVGDVSDINCWSGIPYHFWQSAKKIGFATEPWRLDLTRITWQRIVWNVCQKAIGRGGGFQYSNWFLNLAEAQMPRDLFSSGIISFNQHFPRATSVARAGGTLNHYIDAPFAALSSGRGLDLLLPKRIVERACAQERENYSASQRIITMARWAAEAVVAECAVPAEKVHVILPGANLDLPPDWEFLTPLGRAGIDRDFILGFVGKDWKRKGLPIIIQIRDELALRGWKAKVLAAGNAPSELANRAGVEFVGFIDKRSDPAAFLRFLSACDVGCLFSEREALGISPLEFLRAGVPVAAYAHEGPADTIPPDAGFRFELEDTPTAIADRLAAHLEDEPAQAAFRNSARLWSPLVTWDRCVAEMIELWEAGKITNAVCPWLGLNTNKYAK